MTKQEGAVITAFTGVLCTEFNVAHKYIESIMGRPVFTYEMANPLIREEIKQRATTDFLNIVNNVT